MKNILNLIQKSVIFLKGGAGSGNFGHSGIPGQVGGSSGEGGGGQSTRTSEKIQRNGKQAFKDLSNVRFSDTPHGMSLRTTSNISDIKTGMDLLGLSEKSPGVYTAPKDSGGIGIMASVSDIGSERIVVVEWTGVRVENIPARGK